MLAGLIIVIPILALISFTIWCIYRCRLQTIAYIVRPRHSSVNIEKCGDRTAIETEGVATEGKSHLETLDSYFARGPTVLSGHGGGWGLTKHLTQVQRRRRYPPVDSPIDYQQK
jgi:hypothetical protein